MTGQDKPGVALIGLGTMGANLALNIAENGFPVAVYNRTVETTNRFVAGAGDLAPRLTACESLEALIEAMQPPRSIILMVPAGAPVDQQIDALKPLLGAGDLIIDAGNANFDETRRRSDGAAAGGYGFLGVGVSGGSEGARHGPAIMGGGTKSAWDRVASMMDAISAKYDDVPCSGWMGEDGAGHFVKMVHNGIEYADMQLIAEIYGLLRDGLGKSAAEIGDIFAAWNEGALKSYLIEISAIVARTDDVSSGKPILDVILDRAGQKGTGRWTAINALQLASPVTVIDAAVAARNLSSRLDERHRGEELFGKGGAALANEARTIDQLERALLCGKIVCYAQGFAMLDDASRHYDWSLPLPQIARIWRNGCIIRSAMLDDMAVALQADADTSLMFAPAFADHVAASQGDLRHVASIAMMNGHPVPALAAAVGYFDTMRSARGTANMIQAQRDYFGSHSFERLDAEGSHHGPWAKSD